MKDLILFDFETTGLDLVKDKPVQIGALLVDSETFEYDILVDSLANPGIPMDPEAEKIHGITQAQIDKAPPLMEVLSPLGTYLYGCQGYDLMVGGFNSSTYDMPMFENCIPNTGIRNFPHVDVLDLLYRYCPTMPSKRLENAYPALTGQSAAGAHGAVMDCYFTLCILHEVCRAAQKTVRQLAEELATPRIYPIMPIGKNTGSPVENVPWGWANWMNKNALDMRPDLRVTVDWILENA